MPPSQEASNAFLDWFRSQPGAFFSPDVSLVDLSEHGRGRGVVATADIAADTNLFTIPRHSVLSVDNSEIARKIPHVFNAAKKLAQNDGTSDEGIDLDDLPDPWLELIIVLIYEYFHRTSSPWKPYLDILPHRLDTLMYWGAHELRELQASAIVDKIGKDEAEETFHEKLLPVIKEHQDVFYPPGSAVLGDDELIDLAHRMGSIIMAYAFDLEREDGMEDENEDGWVHDLDGLMSLGLVPMADMLNADAEFNAHLNHEAENLTMTSLRPIRAGEEIMNYYGPLANSELLRRYGYTSAKHRLYDVVELPWPLIRQAIQQHLGASVSLPDDDEMDESYVLERESEGPDETGVNNATASFTEFPEELEDQVAPILAPALGIKIEGREITDEEQRRLGRAFVEVMGKALDARLKQYATSIAADRELLSTQKAATRQRKAIVVRLGEKCLLQEAIDFAANALDETDHDDENTSADERASKKLKTGHCDEL